MAGNKNQIALFDNEPTLWEQEWQDMPEYSHLDTAPLQQIVINFQTREAVKEFASIIGQNITSKTDTLWFPQKAKWTSLNKVYVDES